MDVKHKLRGGRKTPTEPRDLSRQNIDIHPIEGEIDGDVRCLTANHRHPPW